MLLPEINHTLEPDFNSMYLYFLGMFEYTLPPPDTELEEFTVSPNEDVLRELGTKHEPLDDSFQVICISYFFSCPSGSQWYRK